MSAEELAVNRLHVPLAELEASLIDQFVRTRGYDPLKLNALPAHERETLLKEASLHASAKLTEIEARLHFLDETHTSVPGLHKSGLD